MTEGRNHRVAVRSVEIAEALIAAKVPGSVVVEQGNGIWAKNKTGDRLYFESYDGLACSAFLKRAGASGTSDHLIKGWGPELIAEFLGTTDYDRARLIVQLNRVPAIHLVIAAPIVIQDIRSCKRRFDIRSVVEAVSRSDSQYFAVGDILMLVEKLDDGAATKRTFAEIEYVPPDLKTLGLPIGVTVLGIRALEL